VTDSGDGGESGGDELPCATEGEGVCLSVCLSHASIVPKRLNAGSRKLRGTVV